MQTTTKNRIKSKVKEPITREEAELLVSDIAHSANIRRRIIADMDAAKLVIEQNCAQDLAQIDSAIKASSKIVQEWAEANPQEFAKRKTITFGSGDVGFRTGTPKLKTLRKATFDAILEVFIMGTRFKNYVRTRFEIDKEKIIAHHGAGVLSDADLANVALKVVQEETFFIEPQLTEIPARETAPAKEAA